MDVKDLDKKINFAPKEEGQKPKTVPQPKSDPPIALKTCRIRLEDGEVMLTQGAKVEGLTNKELAALKKAKFVE